MIVGISSVPRKRVSQIFLLSLSIPGTRSPIFHRDDCRKASKPLNNLGTD
ncbi:hypothetical protein DM77_3229 [Burkholderia mallei]|nr:hypothetical protein DM46_2943 [Burkholderia mallei]KOT11896.1 hypothetical protein DM77_3229 [Burkholderia mallei]